jgi:hypothetical protein
VDLVLSWPSHSAIVRMSVFSARRSIALVCRLWRILHKRHYVDGWVMWPGGVFLLVTGVLGLVAAT